VAITAFQYGNATKAAVNKEWDWDTDTVAITLHTSTYVPDQDVHDYKNDLTNELTTSGGYTVGGQNLASKTATYTGGTNKLVLDATDLTWTAFSNTWRVAVATCTTPGTDATRPLLMYQLSSVDISPGGADLTLQWHADGLLLYTVS
jgi:hypothetical protein